jgi:hypothetical protein
MKTGRADPKGCDPMSGDDRQPLIDQLSYPIGPIVEALGSIWAAFLLTPLAYFVGVLLGSFVHGWRGPMEVLARGMPQVAAIPWFTCLLSLTGLPIHGAIVLIFGLILLADDLRSRLAGLVGICLLSALNYALFYWWSGWTI